MNRSIKNFKSFSYGINPNFFVAVSWIELTTWNPPAFLLVCSGNTDEGALLHDTCLSGFRIPLQVSPLLSATARCKFMPRERWSQRL